MPLYHDDEQTMLQDTARGFFDEHAPVSHMRGLRDAKDPAGIAHELWRRCGEMGFTMALIPEEDGGLGLGHVEAGIVQEAIGRNLTPSPLLATAIGGVVALRAATNDLRTEWLPRIAEGVAIVALALEEGSKHAPDQITLKACKHADGFVLNGAKRFVPHAHIADLLIVSARSSPGAEPMLLAVTRETTGITMRTQQLADASLVSDIEFDDTVVEHSNVLVPPRDTGALLEEILNAVRVGAAAELIGLADGAMERTFAYLRDRKQFGVEIGSFQALQHRAAHLYGEVELARAAVLKAQRELDGGSGDRSRHAMVAKAIASQAATLAVQEGVQMHGGIGMTDEHDIGLFMKRARVLAELYGDTNYHAHRLASVNGY
ncbi:acyl-CoA dehydrogenase family protein [Novosphingobium sp. HII-3]|uniref:acyl-CoA dehydrogenase family protein n=1 Tax=Novosphingobium sp. HII-3 TaxID=2075565 RepID=UPI000CDADDAB|nr:acyl-CoA dehydrogenase [Novosphingobium sp. HII-3]